MTNEDIVIIGAARTPMGGLQGSLSSIPATELGSIAISAAVERASLTGSDINEVVMGCVLPAGLGQNPARQAALGAGLPDASGATTINKVCGSGMQATMFAFDQIRAGSNQIMVAGGMESMTNAPHLLPSGRSGIKLGHGEVKDHVFVDGLEDAYTGSIMGIYAQATADQYGLTREAMDDFAIESLNRANKAIEEGSLEAEIVPVTVKSRKGDTIVDVDEQPGNARPEKIPGLRPAFKKDGTITAANSSSISDGASALVLTSAGEAEKRGIKPLARIVAHARNSLFELNEAFAMVTMLAMQELDLDHARVNVHGGACAQGHPLGSTGSRIIVTLIHALQKYGKQRGVASLCIGGGEAVAVAIELV
jgi:acetyl-CoA C-acetyltransferase